MTELVTNAAKHRASSIRVSLSDHTTGRYALSVTDNGQGLPDDFDPAKTSGLGMKVIAAMVTRLNGELVFGEPDAVQQGVKFTVLFGVK